MKGLIAALLVLGSTSLSFEACAEPAPDAAPMRYEVPAGRTNHNPLIVPKLGYVVGEHPYKSVIVGRVESAGLDTPEGATGVVLRDFALDGGGDVAYNPRITRADRERYPDGQPGIHVMSWGFRCQNVSVLNVAGPGILYARGNTRPNKWWLDPSYQPEGRITDCFISHCYDGLLVRTGDAMLRGVVVQSVRGVGIQSGSGTTMESCHVYGCQTGMSLLGACYLVGNVTESCEVGLVNNGPGSQIASHRVFGCWGTGIDLQDFAVLSNVVINAGKDSVALRIGTGAAHSVVDVTLGLGSDATGVVLSADKTDLTIRRSWGGRRTVVIDKPVSNCRLDVCADGSLVGVDIQALGWHNQINITARQCEEPLRLPKGGVVPSNVITVNGQPYRGK